MFDTYIVKTIFGMVFIFFYSLYGKSTCTVMAISPHGPKMYRTNFIIIMCRALIIIVLFNNNMWKRRAQGVDLCSVQIYSAFTRHRIHFYIIIWAKFKNLITTTSCSSAYNIIICTPPHTCVRCEKKRR